MKVLGIDIGGSALKRNEKDPKIIEALRLVEISLVDRPANPDRVPRHDIAAQAGDRAFGRAIAVVKPVRWLFGGNQALAANRKKP